jgi:hypothetical protein
MNFQKNQIATLKREKADSQTMEKVQDTIQEKEMSDAEATVAARGAATEEVAAASEETMIDHEVAVDLETDRDSTTEIIIRRKRVASKTGSLATLVQRNNN